MTEAQDVQGLEPKATTPTRDDWKPPSRHVEMEGRSWTIVDLEDGLSWNLYAQDPQGQGTAPRLAHITISERGYYSTDPAGVVRGPYTTLDEAAYPLALNKRVLLDDPDDRTPVVAPGVPVVEVTPRRRSGRLLLLVVVAVAAALIVPRLAPAGRSRQAS